VINSIVAVASDGLKPEEILVQGKDFYSNPRISPDGNRLAWLAWNHPDMAFLPDNLPAHLPQILRRFLLCPTEAYARTLIFGPTDSYVVCS
jgi:hypothetical protein